MEYTSVSETAKKWGVSVTCVYRAAREGRIPDAEFVDGIWYIPEDAENPTKKIVAPKPGYLSSVEAAEKWGITSWSVCDAAKEGRIPGAELIGGRWHIPSDVDAPENRRTYRKPGYLSVAKAAEKWGVSVSYVRRAAKEGRILGAELIDGKWHIPNGAQEIVERHK